LGFGERWVQGGEGRGRGREKEGEVKGKEGQERG